MSQKTDKRGAGQPKKLPLSPGLPVQGSDSLAPSKVILGSEPSAPIGTITGCCTDGARRDQVMDPATTSCIYDAHQQQLAEAPNTSEMSDGVDISSSFSLKRKFVEVEESKTSSPPNKCTPSFPSLPPPQTSFSIASEFHSWPKYLVVHSPNPNLKLSAVSPFKFFDGIKYILANENQREQYRKHKKNIIIVPEPKLTSLASGDFLIKLSDEKHSRKLLQTKAINTLPVEITIHKTLNSCKGMIRCSKLDPCDEDEIVQNLQSQGVTGVKRLITHKDNKQVKTNTYILDFSMPEPPLDLKVAYMNIPVEQYFPNPLRCYQCQIYGHHKSKCKREAICGKCAKPAHDNDCTSPPQCVNCTTNKNHPSFSKQCPKWKFEKEVVAVRTKFKLSFPEARTIVENRYPSGSPGTTAANIVKSGVTKISRTIATQYSSEDFQTDKNEPKNIPQPASPKVINSQSKSTATSPSRKNSPSNQKTKNHPKIDFSQTSKNSQPSPNSSSSSPGDSDGFQTPGKKGAKAPKKTGRDPKNARDAIISKNRYGDLPEEGDMDVEHSPSLSPIKPSAPEIKGQPPDRQRGDQFLPGWLHKTGGHPPKPVMVDENMDTSPPDTTKLKPASNSEKSAIQLKRAPPKT